MKRIEIIANNAVEQDIMEIFEHLEGKGYYTRINGVHGFGSSGPRHGDHIWPEENSIFIVYCSEEESELIKKAIGGLKTRFPEVGIKCFIL